MDEKLAERSTQSPDIEGKNGGILKIIRIIVTQMQ